MSFFGIFLAGSGGASAGVAFCAGGASASEEGPCVDDIVGVTDPGVAVGGASTGACGGTTAVNGGSWVITSTLGLSLAFSGQQVFPMP